MSATEANGGDLVDPTVELTDSVDPSNTNTGRMTGYYLSVVHREDGDRGPSIHRVGETPFLIGRGPLGAEQGLVINDRGLSKKHVEFFCKLSAPWLRDRESRNGTFVDGRPVVPKSAVMLHPGSVVRAGSNVFVVRAQPPPLDEGTELGKLLPGISAQAANVRARIAQLAKLKGPVLLLGETGTGKEYAAHALHRESGLKQGNFVAVNCALLTPGLAQSELFGSKKGGFTDAQERDGLIAEAGGGTLFLDEIGELDPKVQAELLRFLQDGIYRRVGSSDDLRSSARIVGATHVNLKTAVAEGKFREDLEARLNSSGAPIHLAPLRERREDLPGWFGRFVEEMARELEEAKELRTIPRSWTAGVTECLLLHDWPKNLRYLRVVAREAVLSALGETTITATHLPAEIAKTRAQARDSATASEPEEPANIVVPKETHPVELTREALIELLTRFEGNMKRAAEAATMERRSFYRFCKSLNVSPEDYRPQKQAHEE